MVPTITSGWRERIADFREDNFPDITREEVLTAFNNLPALSRLPDYFTNFVEDLDIAHKLKIFVLSLATLQSANGKTIPAFEMLVEAEQRLGTLHDVVVVIASSGNTGFSVARLRKIFGVKRVIVVVDKSVPEGKQEQIRFVGAEIKYPENGMGTIAYAHQLAQGNGYLELNQYEDWACVRAHMKYTAKHLHHQLILRESLKDPANRIVNPMVLVFCAGGSTSTTVAVKEYAKMHGLDWKVVMVTSMSEAEKVPGSRTVESIRKDIKFPWESSIDGLVSGITLKESTAMSKKLYHSGTLGAFTSGLVTVGIPKYFWDLHDAGSMEAILSHEGDIVAVPIFMDAPLVSLSDYGKILK